MANQHERHVPRHTREARAERRARRHCPCIWVWSKAPGHPEPYGGPGPARPHENLGPKRVESVAGRPEGDGLRPTLHIHVQRGRRLSRLQGVYSSADQELGGRADRTPGCRTRLRPRRRPGCRSSARRASSGFQATARSTAARPKSTGGIARGIPGSRRPNPCRSCRRSPEILDRRHRQSRRGQRCPRAARSPPP